jgi:putative ABC transport system substrate-binding protein
VKRREFIAGLAGAAAWPLAARTQQKTNPTIGVLTWVLSDASASLFAALRDAPLIAYLFNPNTFDDGRIGRIEAAAHALGVRLTILNAATPDKIETVFAEIARQRIGALLLDPDPMFYGVGDQLVALAAQYAVPTMYQTREHVAAGGLMSYAADIPEAFRLVGIYTGRILKGEKPADLPVRQSTKVVSAINLKTAKALCITIPDTLLATADEVIQ